MNPEFEVHRLTEEGVEKASAIAHIFDSALAELASFCPPWREFSLMRTKLEEACFFANKAMARDPRNQQQSKGE